MLRTLTLAALLAPFLSAIAVPELPQAKAGKATVGQDKNQQRVQSQQDHAVTLSDLKAVQKKVQGMYPKALACTVAVARKGMPAGASGVIVSADGLLMTCAHVIKSTGDDVDVYLADGRKLRGKALGSNTAGDAAMIQITDKGRYPFAEVRSSAELGVNEPCVMLGHAQMRQEERTPPLRIGRFLDVGKSRRGFVRTSCTMMGGDSGGPLFDLQGRVIGINSNINRSLTQNFHVSTDTFLHDWERLRKGERWGARRRSSNANRIILGVNVQKTGDGALRISRVQRYASADAAGVKVGDLLLAFAGKQIEDPRAIGKWLTGKKAGERVVMKLRRGEDEFDVRVRLLSARQVSAAMLRARGSRGAGRGSRGRRAGSAGAISARWVGSGAGNPFRKKGQAPFDGPWLRGVRTVLDHVVAQASASVVPVYVGERQVALATCVRKGGYLLTKASEIERQKPVVRIGEKRLPARIVQRFPAYDLAMIRIDAELPVLSLGNPTTDPRVGTLVTSAGPAGQSLELGVVSVATRSVNARRPFLGVSFEARSEGLVVRSVEPGSSAAKMGLIAGDEVLSLNGKDYHKVPPFIAVLRKLAAGSPIRIGIDQDGALQELEGRLGSKFTDDRVGRLRIAGGQLSKQRVGFARAIQTDLTLDPAQCGSPLIDLDGRILGISIARSRRVASYAIPTAVLRELLTRKRVEKI